MPSPIISTNQFNFPTPRRDEIIETDFMLEVINRTMAIHPGNSVWYGEARIGKTTTARHFVNRIMNAYDPANPHAFRAVHYEAGEIPGWSGNEQKKGLKSLHNSTIGRIDEGLYRSDPPETIANSLVHALKRKNIQIVFVDEAGNLSLDAIRGILMAYDAAKNLGHNLSFVFIGMDDLPVKVTTLPQVYGRMHEWCYFQPYSVQELSDLLEKLQPQFTSIDLNNINNLEIVECLYDLCGGYLGLIVPFLQKVDKYQSIKSEEIDSKYLRAIHLRTQLERELSISKSKEICGGKPPKKVSEKDKNSKADRKNKRGKNEAKV
jgi:hypothetical protein